MSSIITEAEGRSELDTNPLFPPLQMQMQNKQFEKEIHENHNMSTKIYQ